jgi:hypothetical protein
LQENFYGSYLKKYYKINDTEAEMEIDESNANGRRLTESGSGTSLF